MSLHFLDTPDIGLFLEQQPSEIKYYFPNHLSRAKVILIPLPIYSIPQSF